MQTVMTWFGKHWWSMEIPRKNLNAWHTWGIWCFLNDHHNQHQTFKESLTETLLTKWADKNQYVKLNMSERGFGNSPLACASPSLLYSWLRLGAATTSPRLSAQEVNVLQTQLLFGHRSKKTTENGRSSRCKEASVHMRFYRCRPARQPGWWGDLKMLLLCSTCNLRDIQHRVKFQMEIRTKKISML